MGLYTFYLASDPIVMWLGVMVSRGAKNGMWILPSEQVPKNQCPL